MPCDARSNAQQFQTEEQEKFNERADQNGGYVEVDTSARVALRHSDADVFVRNRTNADDYTFRGITSGREFYGFRLRPRTIALELSRNS